MTSDDDVRWVTDIVPYDITVARDPSIQALVMLAVSLGWNAHHKNGQPIVLTARNGTQKRLPTNTSVRMSVFQTALSSIMLYTEDDTVPTIELIDRIIEITKPSKEHERRLFLAVGETPAQHRERLVAIAAESQGSREPQPVTTRIELLQAGRLSSTIGKPTEEVAARAATAAADGQDHGGLVKRGPFLASYSRSGTESKFYESESSLERVWEDGYKDYECPLCGRAYSTPKGAGSHRQVHIQAGEAKPSNSAIWSNRPPLVKGPARPKTSSRSKKENIPSVDDLVFEEPPSEDEVLLTEEVGLHPLVYADIVGKIAELILPNQIKRWEEQIAELRAENEALREDLAHMEGDFEALIDLMESRRKKS